MRRVWHIAVILALTIPISLMARAQDTGLPRYAVSFPYKWDTRIAVLDTNGKWHFDDLPKATWEYSGITFRNTVWSPNSPTAYIVLPATGDGQYRYVYAHDLLARKQSPVVFLNKAKSDEDIADVNVSPDGRYLWIDRPLDGSSRL